jgi:hypothetical protein
MQIVWYLAAVAVVALALWPVRRSSQLICTQATHELPGRRRQIIGREDANLRPAGPDKPIERHVRNRTTPTPPTSPGT